MERGKRTLKFNPSNENSFDLQEDLSSQEKDENVQQEESWAAFSKSKQEIQALQRELLPIYLDYRKLLVESAKEICQQSGVKNFNCASLEMNPSREKQIEEAIVASTSKEEQMTGEDKERLMQKIMKERQIKKYYKSKHQDHQRDELDQENDQELVYQIYREAFNDNQFKEENKRILIVNNSQKQISSTPKQATHNRKPTVSRIIEVPAYSNGLNYHELKINDSHQNQAHLMSKVNVQMAFDHELSFDQDNEQYFSADKVAYDQRQQVLSEANYGMIRNKKTSQKRIKHEDQLSHTDDVYKNFVLQQQEQLAKQKLRVEKLSDIATKVINNQMDSQQGEKDKIKDSGKNIQENDLSHLRYLLEETMDLFAAGECIKFFLKFRSYQLLDKLYANASSFYNEQIRFQDPLKVKHFSQVLKAIMPQDEQFVRIAIANIFESASEISYEQFMDKLTPSINQRQFELLDGSKGHKTFDMTVKLFAIWAEMDYFQKQVHRLFGDNQIAIGKFIQVAAEKTVLSPASIADFITRGKVNRVSKLKAELYFRKIVGASLSVNGFLKWVKSNELKVNTKFEQQQEQDKYQYYYDRI